jgi:hypothetical protein
MVYLIANESGQVKIGYSAKSPEARLKSMQTGNHEKLTLVWVIAGDDNDERILHNVFKDKRVKGEWFSTANCENYFTKQWVEIYLNSWWIDTVFIDDYAVSMYIFDKYNLAYETDPIQLLEKLCKKRLVVKDTPPSSEKIKYRYYYDEALLWNPHLKAYFQSKLDNYVRPNCGLILKIRVGQERNRSLHPWWVNYHEQFYNNLHDRTFHTAKTLE